jgi:hypothetical protein
MSLIRKDLLILPLEYTEVFCERGDKLAKLVGASALLYAAIAMISFDNTGPAEAIIDSSGLVPEDIIWWLEDVMITNPHLFQNVRTFHHGQELVHVLFEAGDSTLYVSSTARPLLRDHPGFSRRRSNFRRSQRDASV